jgi:predicted HicB family RNase H-like nuclease
VQNGAKFYAQKDFFSMIVAFLSSELHREISIQAAQERITLNQYVLKALEQSLLPV